MLEVGRRLSRGDRLELSTCACGFSHPHLAAVPARCPSPDLAVDGGRGGDARPGARRVRRVGAARTVGGLPHSDQVGCAPRDPPRRGPPATEILSRGVPVGAVQVPPSGGLLVLLYGRLLTAGYPIPYVATTVSLDTLGQVRPGDQLVLRGPTRRPRSRSCSPHAVSWPRSPSAPPRPCAPAVAHIARAGAAISRPASSSASRTWRAASTDAALSPCSRIESHSPGSPRRRWRGPRP